MNEMVNNARVLLERLEKSTWSELLVRTAQGTIFIAKSGGGANPMREAAESGEQTVISAPHLGSVISVAAVGSEVLEGGEVCRLSVLGETVGVPTSAAGIIEKTFVSEGMLVEFETPLVVISSARGS